MIKEEKNHIQLFNMAALILAVACFCGSALAKSCALFCVGIGIVLIICSRRVHIVTKLNAIVVLVIVTYIVYLKVADYSFMPQALALIKIDESLIYWFKERHIHAIRLAISYPAFLLHGLFDIELNLAFGYYCSIVFSLIYTFISRSIDYYVTSKKICIELVIVAFVLFLSLIMNGRICFAFLGFSILLFEMTELYKEEKTDELWIIRYARVLIGLILSTVSSGTMMVCLLFTLASFGLRVVRQKKIQPAAVRLWIICIIGSPVIYIGFNYVLRMIDKNITYFGGGISGIINMLQHGLGSIFGNPTGTFVIILILFGIVLFMINIVALVYLYRQHPDSVILVVGANIAFYGLFVGISTGTLILIPGIILIAVFIDKLCGLKEETYDGKKYIQFS